ncbi:hypothetical protein MPTK1_7g06920 [Marchantia polymorpha subsp. ruderalis]|uniref:Uncharacterized protein n=2 Tax=Marchantia polymorpha TaxID=3197 RepID=A0AAF6BWX2_MARPO|nr:hypothetical protein MARPO_0233s0002 [Marchantia polymorpha]BBN16506.1 hypothetical protein Mp_7g06920 [Marchantia polymorpha subsp. ruderalis]|eukprot:PTQ27048.1 hypothetical protein MARPO_0233s0002 [Marchantia polymorpha]
MPTTKLLVIQSQLLGFHIMEEFSPSSTTTLHERVYESARQRVKDKEYRRRESENKTVCFIFNSSSFESGKITGQKYRQCVQIGVKSIH